MNEKVLKWLLLKKLNEYPGMPRKVLHGSLLKDKIRPQNVGVYLTKLNEKEIFDEVGRYFLVDSQRTPYLVTIEDGKVTCSCPDFRMHMEKKNLPCKHVIACVMFCGESDDEVAEEVIRCMIGWTGIGSD